MLFCMTVKKTAREIWQSKIFPHGLIIYGPAQWTVGKRDYSTSRHRKVYLTKLVKLCKRLIWLEKPWKWKLRYYTTCKTDTKYTMYIEIIIIRLWYLISITTGLLCACMQRLQNNYSYPAIENTANQNLYKSWTILSMELHPTFISHWLFWPLYFLQHSVLNEI